MAAEITAAGGKAVAGVADVQDRDAVLRAADIVGAALGPVHILVSDVFLPQLVAAQGDIVNISSVAGRTTAPNSSVLYEDWEESGPAADDRKAKLSRLQLGDDHDRSVSTATRGFS